MKKRSCRRTNEEQTIHKAAVKIGKMSEEALVAMYKAAKGAGFNEDAPQKIQVPDGPSAAEFIQRVECMSGTGAGIGKATVAKLRALYEEMNRQAS